MTERQRQSSLAAVPAMLAGRAAAHARAKAKRIAEKKERLRLEAQAKREHEAIESVRLYREAKVRADQRSQQMIEEAREELEAQLERLRHVPRRGPKGSARTKR